MQASILITRTSNNSCLFQQLNGHIISTQFGFDSSSTAIYLCSNGWWSLCQGSAIILSLVLSDTIEVPLSDILGKLKTTEGGRFQGNASHTQRVQTCLCQVELSANERYNVYSQGLDFNPSNKLHDRLVEQVPTVHPNKMSCNCLNVQEEIATC